jgi:cell division protein FtsI (penicillin-binding protein 3)
MDEFQAEWGIVIVSRPSTGEILALANSPEPNPADPGSNWRRIDWNYAIRQNFDPGSTFKIITAAAALECGGAGLNDIYDVHLGYRSFGSSSIGDHHRYESLDFRGVIIHSSNVGATMIADQVGPRRLYDTIRAFGLGRRTGIDLPAEEDGLLNPLENWTKYSHNYISVGYEINVTAAQMLQVINIVANGGISVPLRVVLPTREVTALSEEQPAPPRRVISETTARRLNGILIDAVKEGTGRPARVPGYTAAGKTGTAQRIDPDSGSYSSRAHLSSFTGYVPAERPELSIIVVIDRPKGKYYGGEVAAPVFAAVAARTLRYLKIPENTTGLGATLMTADLEKRERR